LRQRGDAATADKIAAEIIEKHPEHPEALLLQAEALERQGKLKEARDVLAGLVAGDAKNIAAERKHAELVLKLAERDRMVTAATTGDFASIMNPEGVRKSASTAAFFSMLLPGFGQVYNGHLVKGIVFVALAVLGWIGVLVLGTQGRNVTEWFWPSISLLLVTYLVAIIDAAVAAGRTETRPRPVRPEPPVDKPFE
jgi:TM2 domain-containing membrane protein YozV